jgi:hypothetical protein
MLTPCFGEILSYALLEYKHMKKEKVHFYFKGLNIATQVNCTSVLLNFLLGFTENQL